VRRELPRVARRYDLTVLSAPADGTGEGAAALLPAPDAIVCARVGHTEIRTLARMIERLELEGANVRGIVLWTGEPSALPGLDLESRGRAPGANTAEVAVAGV